MRSFVFQIKEIKTNKKHCHSLSNLTENNTLYLRFYRHTINNICI